VCMRADGRERVDGWDGLPAVQHCGGGWCRCTDVLQFRRTDAGSQPGHLECSFACIICMQQIMSFLREPSGKPSARARESRVQLAARRIREILILDRVGVCYRLIHGTLELLRNSHGNINRWQRRLRLAVDVGAQGAPHGMRRVHLPHIPLSFERVRACLCALLYRSFKG
jgi:hypothetical protein